MMLPPGSTDDAAVMPVNLRDRSFLAVAAGLLAAGTGVAAGTSVLARLTSGPGAPRPPPPGGAPGPAVAAGTSVLARLTSGPVARRTAPAVVPPARTLPGGDVRVGDGGSDRRHGIPVGYPHTSLGAAQAATNLLVGYLGTPMFD